MANARPMYLVQHQQNPFPCRVRIEALPNVLVLNHPGMISIVFLLSLRNITSKDWFPGANECDPNRECPCSRRRVDGKMKRKCKGESTSDSREVPRQEVTCSASNVTKDRVAGAVAVSVGKWQQEVQSRCCLAPACGVTLLSRKGASNIILVRNNAGQSPYFQ